MRTPEERLALLDRTMSEVANQGLIHLAPDDEPLDGRTVAFDGRTVVNFGSCSYLGLELDPRMRAGVVDAVIRYGTQFSSSRAYLSAPPYTRLETKLESMFGGHVIVAPTTTLGHLAALPVLVESGDVVILDQMVHHSVQMAANQLRAQGTTVELIRHNRMDRLESMISRLARRHKRIWYLADGVYSMFADLAPFAELASLLDRHEQLHIYIDDSHGVGWTGRHGRGPALEHLGTRERLIVAASLNKSFAAAGGALIFPNAELKRRVRLLGGPMIFSGPIQPPMLGAALASAEIHLTPEIEERQAALRERVDFCTELLQEFCLPLAAKDLTPIRYVTLGVPAAAQEVTARLLDDGFYVNIAQFPAVPMKQAGVRITLTLHHRLEDIRALVEALSRHVPGAIGRSEHQRGRRSDPASTAKTSVAVRADDAAPVLRLERHRSIRQLDLREWDELLGGRGTFTAEGLGFLEQTFVEDNSRPEDRWSFHYYLVRNQHGRPVLATFFTAALWKEDLLSSGAVSRAVEQRRRQDPYYLTSVTFAMGSLLTEGDHLYLDREGAWSAALDLLLEAVTADAQAVGAGTVVLRDLAPDAELASELNDRGFAQISMPDSFVLAPVSDSDSEWLAGLSPKARAHQRREVLPWDDAFSIEILRCGDRIPTEAEFDHLHRLYRNVQQRGLEINAFELPRTLLPNMLRYPCWELMLLRLRPGGDDPTEHAPVAFGAHFIGERHYAPMLVGLDYSYVRSHHSYRQALRQSLLRARHHGAERVLLGMGAPLEKKRVGARPHARVTFVQASDHYSQEVLAMLEANLATPRSMVVTD